MKMLECSPFDLIPNKWNTNKVDRDNFEKLKKSLTALGNFKPVVCRETRTGALEILGGFHRVEAAKELGWLTVPVINLGSIDDNKAKEISLVDNTRYGKDDAEALAKLLDEMDTDLLEIVLPEEETIELPEPELEPDMGEDKLIEKDDDFKTLRFRLEIDKAEEIEAILHNLCRDKGFKLIDGYNDTAQALYHILVIEGR